MSEYIYRQQLFITPSIEGEDLLFYGIKKLETDLKLKSLNKIINPEGGEWTFLFNDNLNRLYINKDNNNYVFTGDALPEVVESLKKIMTEKYQSNKKQAP
jgi:hypothetical protein